MARRRSTTRRASRPRAQTATFRNLEIAAAAVSQTADGTSARLTNLTDLAEATSTPDVELLRSKLTWCVGKGSYRASAAGNNFRYSYALYVGPSSLDVADIDPSLVGAQGLPYWAFGKNVICAEAHLRSVTSTTFENELQTYRPTIRARGSGRRIQHFGTSLWFAESVNGADLTDVQWSFDLGVQLP